MRRLATKGTRHDIPKYIEPGPFNALRAAFADIGDEALWEALRTRRRELATAQGVPPYVVFHDATLAEMVAQRPTTLAAFAEITGVGASKLAAYGNDFVEVIRAHGRNA